MSDSVAKPEDTTPVSQPEAETQQPTTTAIPAEETLTTESKKRSRDEADEESEEKPETRGSETSSDGGLASKRQKNESEVTGTVKEKSGEDKSTEASSDVKTTADSEEAKESEKASEESKESEKETGDKENPSSDSVDEPKDSKPSSAFSEPKYLSSGTTFKGGFGSFASSSFNTSATNSASTASVFAEPKTETSKSSETSNGTTSSLFSTPSVFGSGFSSFASFTAPASNKANPWAESNDSAAEKKEDKDTKDEESSKSITTSSQGNGIGGTDVPDLYAQVAVPLEQQKVETGEEYEKSNFSCRAKLYALDIANPSEGWKERGVGTLHVNSVKTEYEDEFKNKSKARIVMRADGILKVILNVPFNKGTEVFSGMKSSLSSEKFVRITAFEDGKPFQYSLRTGNPDTAKKLFDAINELIPSS